MTIDMQLQRLTVLLQAQQIAIAALARCCDQSLLASAQAFAQRECSTCSQGMAPELAQLMQQHALAALTPLG